MTYLLDSNVCIAFLNGTSKKVRDRLLALPSGDVSLCSIVKAELLYGARHSKRVDANLRKLAHFFGHFASLPFDDTAAESYGLLREQLTRAGTPIGGNDLLIAAISLANDATLVTRNEEFHRVPALRLEDWE